MAGKNTAVFGIYPDFASVERAVPALREAGFRSTDISVLFPENVGTKDFGHEKASKAPEGAVRVISRMNTTPRLPKARRPVGSRAAPLVRRSDGSPESAPWPFPGWVPSLPQVRSWPRSRAQQPAAQSVASPVL